MGDRKSKVLMGIYGSSMTISITALSIVAGLEVFMLAYTLIDPALYGEYIGTYRVFYISLLSMAAIYIALYLFVRKDLAHRFRILNVANPVCAVFFFAWALGIEYFDAIHIGTLDPTVFMTFSFTVPVSFFLFPAAYAAVVVVADAVLLYGGVFFSGSVAPVINFSIFFIFQIVLGVSFMKVRMRLAERIVQEQENADIDVLTGFSNRRMYEKDLKRFEEAPRPDALTYVVIDINGLKEANDNFGHAAGDKLIIGTARCIEQCFGEKGRMFRIGGDEFVVLADAGEEETAALLGAFDKSLESWSADNGMTLSVAYGQACSADYPDGRIIDLARAAEKKMYMAKDQYYRESGKDRRRY